MKWLGTREVKLSAIVLPGDFAGRKKAAHVAELAKSIEAIGVIEPPVLEAGSMRLIAGGDRVAAALAAGLKRIEVRLVEGSPRELERVRIEENLRRRHDDRDELISQLLGLAEEDADAEPEEIIDTQCAITPQVGEKLPTASGRPETSRGRAREEVAKALGMTTKAVARADERAAKKKRPPEPEPAPAGGPPSKPPPPPAVDPLEALGFDSRGIDLAPSLREEVRGAAGTCIEVSRMLGQCQRMVAMVQQTALGGAIHQRLYQKLHALAEEARSLKPASVCPACKAGETVLACTACRSTGVVTEAQVEAAKAVRRDVKPANGAPAKKRRIEMEDGSEVDW